MALSLSCRSYGSSSPLAPDIPPNTITIAGMMFYPTTLTVTKGTTVTWQNNDNITHTSISYTGAWNTGDITGGASAAVTFNTAGTYTYYCKYHVSMGMRGTIVVK